MSVAFHRGLSHALRVDLQQKGVRLEEIDAQRALAGLLTRETDMRGNPVKSPENQRAIRSEAAKWVDQSVTKILGDPVEKQRYIREWEEEHPGKDPYPPAFAQEVLRLLRDIDPEDAAATIQMVIELAEGEQLYG